MIIRKLVIYPITSVFTGTLRSILRNFDKGKEAAFNLLFVGFVTEIVTDRENEVKCIEG